MKRQPEDSPEGNSQSSAAFIENSYDELRRMAARLTLRERNNHTLQPTALVHELYLRLVEHRSPDWKGRTHFLAVAATNFRRILIEHARASGAAKRGGSQEQIPLDLVAASESLSCEALLTLHQALLELESVEPRAAKVTELRFFGGLLETEIAEELGLSLITVKRDWRFARAWLAAHLQ